MTCAVVSGKELSGECSKEVEMLQEAEDINDVSDAGYLQLRSDDNATKED